MSAKIAVAVSSDGFVAADTTWVDWNALEAFSAAVASIESIRSGEAGLVGMSPDGFALRVMAASTRGGAVVRGRIARDCTIERSPWRQELRFVVPIPGEELGTVSRQLAIVCAQVDRLICEGEEREWD